MHICVPVTGSPPLALYDTDKWNAVAYFRCLCALQTLVRGQNNEMFVPRQKQKKKKNPLVMAFEKAMRYITWIKQ